MVTKSIRWRLQLWLAFLLVCILSGFGVTAYQLHRTNLLRQIDEDLQRRVTALTADVRGIPPHFGGGPKRPQFEPAPGGNPMNDGFGPPPKGPRFEGGRGGPGKRRFEPDGMEGRGFPDTGPERREILISAQTQRLFDDVETNGFYYAVWSRSGSLLKRSTNLPPEVFRPQRSDLAMTIETRTGLERREAYLFTEIGECALAGRSIAGDLAELRGFGWWLLAAGVAVLAVGLGGGWLATSRAIRPIEDIGAAASRISAGNLSERINVTDTDSELGRLAGVLNSTFARLDAAFAQQRQFTADASHELRTPLAVIISEAQSILARERSPAEYRETIETCLETAQQMRRLTESLLELARFDGGQEAIERVPCDLAERARASVELIRPLARRRHIGIECDLAPVETLGDPDRLGQVLTNLLSNAVAYNKDAGRIVVSTRVASGSAVLTVADTGPGIAAEDLPHVFKRFYRADKARARADGHAGLGLAICKAVIEAHGGVIEAASPPGGGAVFTVRLPLR